MIFVRVIGGNAAEIERAAAVAARRPPNPRGPDKSARR